MRLSTPEPHPSEGWQVRPSREFPLGGSFELALGMKGEWTRRVPKTSNSNFEISYGSLADTEDIYDKMKKLES